MIPLHEIAYARKREAEERAASRKARDPSARIIHSQLADYYAWRARDAQCEPAG